jgi:AAA+ ATPase superfamily predicted ATPase
MGTERKVNIDMGQMIKKDHESLLLELKEWAGNIEIDKRKEFEKELLRLAQEITDDRKRNAVYEVLVSLQTIWNRYQPEKGLQKKFRDAFNLGNDKEAEDNYKKLAKQGLDYIGTFDTREGAIIPIVTKEKHVLLKYNKKEFTIYTPQLELLEKIPIPGSLAIIDIIAPFADISSGCMETDKITDPKQEIWMLFEDSDGKKAIASTDIQSFTSKEVFYKLLEQKAISLDQTVKDVLRISCFKSNRILVSKKSVYYLTENEKWEQWYTTGDEITVFEPTKKGFLIGHANGSVMILKKPGYMGVRSAFKGFPGAIKSIRAAGRFVLIYSKNCLRIADFQGNPVMEPPETWCEIMASMILNDKLMMLLANGMLLARELKQENICWQMNLGDIYDQLFSFKQYVYCRKISGETMVFEIPPFLTMAKELESKNIYVEKQLLDMEPTAPIRYIPDFIGRGKILSDIQNAYKAHFLLYGEPRVGKTSLLNVLRDALSEKAKCCVVDMTQLLKDADSFDKFELNFMEKCLGQHFMNFSELPGRDGYRYTVLRTMVAKIKGDMSFCVFGMDNFFIPTHFDKDSTKNFKEFLGSMLHHPEVRLIITCQYRGKDDIERYIDELDIAKERELLYREIPLFSEGEVKNELRKKISLQQSVVDEIYEYTGRFPHLIHLYDRWIPGSNSIQEQSKRIAKNFSEKIFEYFRDLTLDSSLLITTVLYEKLAAEKITYTIFYERFPFLNNILPKHQLEIALTEIAGYGSGLSVEKDAEGFKISLSDNAQLFYEAVKHISWIKAFKALYEFTSVPDQERAHQVAHTFTRITQSELDSNKHLEQGTEKHKNRFCVCKLTEHGLQALKMPLATFIVIPLKSWQKEEHMEALFDLTIELQEFGRKTGESKIFYILLFELHGIPKENVKKDLEGLERISIIDAIMMKDIILAETPKDKASQYIFDQLSIRERSPYTTAGAVPDSLFYGRQMEMALIRGLPENIGIFGTRTIGKTSLLHKLHKAFQSQSQWKVFDMDCSRIESEESLLQNLAEKMNIPKVEKFNMDSMEKFRLYITKQAESGGHRYLFLLDEVDRLVQYDMRHDEKIFNTFNRMSNEIMKNNETAARFILFGFQQMFEQMKNPSSRLYNFMVFLPLQALDWEGAMSLVTRPIENIRVRWNNKDDALYLVDSCSRHPRLLQAACHALLTHLDSKKEKRDIIERIDVDIALTSPEFREICMRLYRDQSDDKDGDNEKKKVDRKKILFARIRGMEKKETRATNTPDSNKGKGFLSDLHRITILSAIRIFFEEKREIFTIMDLQKELKGDNIDVSPNIMRNILDRLCLSGNFRLRDESTIIAKQGTKIREVAEPMKIYNPDLTVDHPDDYVGSDATFPKFTFEFGVKIFPKLLVAHFGGLKQCEEERHKLIEKGDWKEWLSKY